MNGLGKFTAAVFVSMIFAGAHIAAAERIEVRIVTDEAEAVLSALDTIAAGREISSRELDAIFNSEGYRRLKAREHSLGRSFGDDEFRRFLKSDGVAARREALRRTLLEWKRADVEAIGSAVLRYLPEAATIKAKVYPVVKPATNSFVFDLDNDPAIFLYLDENMSRAQFGNTLAHELHHIGFGTACPPPDSEKSAKSLTPGEMSVVRWTGAFGEGFAMLAAAGGTRVHPHSSSSEEDRRRWDRDVSNFGRDLIRVQSFFQDLLSGRLTGEQEITTARSFYGIQGPWYTVGWKMAVVVEEELGRSVLVDCFCDGKKLLPTYNRAVEQREKKTGEKLPRWDPKVFVGEMP